MPTVLVVDDSPVDRRVIEGLLHRQADLDWLIEYAEDGLVALAKMQDLLPDVVVTDLQMPGMDGLQLVTAIGARYPTVPVILVTAQGSETIAIEALDKGAASYVPKHRLADRLMSTIEQVMSAAHSELRHRRVSKCIECAKFRLQIDNDAEMIRSVVDYFHELLEEIQFADNGQRVHIAIALEETLVNAVFHGNLELPAERVRQGRSEANRDEFAKLAAERRSATPYRERKVSVDAELSPREIRFVVRDQGAGFALDKIPQRGDPSTLENASGRGLVLMRNFMDEVIHNETGNEVTLIKRVDVPSVA